MAFWQRLQVALKAGWQYGFGPLLHLAAYQSALRSGWLRWQTRTAPVCPDDLRIDLSALPQADIARLQQILQPHPADENYPRQTIEDLRAHCANMINGNARLYGGILHPLRLGRMGFDQHWTAYEGRARFPELGGDGDIKDVWEAGRFGWALDYVRLAVLTGDPAPAQTFWRFAETFWREHPPYAGLQWVSGQEVALRLITWAAAASLLRSVPGGEAPGWLAEALAAHAARIPPGLSYARAQNNNHRLSEAAGLYTAGLALPGHPQARAWRSQGWTEFHRAIAEQITPQGEYVQHSTNYLRLALQLGVWMFVLSRNAGQAFPALSKERLAAATEWLSELRLGSRYGRVVNLGPNDGAYILPLTQYPFESYLPVLHAASACFRDCRYWAEDSPVGDMSAWLDITIPKDGCFSDVTPGARSTPLILESIVYSSLAMRVAQFHGRPGHADQLHVDVFYWDEPVTLDAGTYRYNAAPPWDNTLRTAFCHNTVTIDGTDQMNAAGKFLYLDPAQGHILKIGWFDENTAEHNGYDHLGVRHQRRVAGDRHQWTIEDRLIPPLQPIRVGKAPAERPLTLDDLRDPIKRKKLLKRYKAKRPEPRQQPIPEDKPYTAEQMRIQNPVQVRLHWLLPDWPYQVQQFGHSWVLRLDSPLGVIHLHLRALDVNRQTHLTLVRAGRLAYGVGTVRPTLGWYSPTYGEKQPALSVLFDVRSPLPVQLISRFDLPEPQQQQSAD